MFSRQYKKLILHIGTGKTGSSSIQDSLGESRDILLEHNICYPNTRPFNHIFTFVPFFLRDPASSFVFRRQLLPSEDKVMKIENYRKLWVKEIRGCSKDFFIISAEDLTLPFFERDAILKLRRV